MKKLRSTDNVVKILFLLRDSEEPLGLTDISNMTEINKSTVYNILSTLMFYNLISKDEITKKYSLGVGVLGLSTKVLNRLDIRSIARPFMNELATKTHSTVTLGIANNNKFIFIERIDGVENVRFFCDIGKSVNFFEGAASKAYYAFAEPDLQKNTIDKVKIKHPNFDEEVEEIIKNGYSTSNEEVDKGVKAFGAPIFNHENKVVAGIAIANISSLLDKKLEAINISYLLDISKKISENLGADINSL
ncbi:IclR family transcriptional regulator [Peptoniphilus sp.]|jgi:IclR family KDG regulon transcriptional repressor|uniref:IclR family transcriptional regulator n=1 Tax=Peptoniphilus sp. TaxID=1971214 RepID=UPI003D8BEA83